MTIQLSTLLNKEIEVPISLVCLTDSDNKINYLKNTLETKKNEMIFVVPDYKARHAIAFHLSVNSSPFIIDQDLTPAVLEEIEDCRSKTLILYDVMKLDSKQYNTLTRKTWKEVVCFITILNPNSEGTVKLNLVDELFQHPAW